MDSKKFSLSVLLITTAFYTQAQFRLPQFDVEAKGAFSVWKLNGDNKQHNSIDIIQFISWQGGAHIQLNQRIAIGGFYSRSFSGKVAYKSGEKSDAQVLITGIDLRLSGGRSARVRPYLSVNYSKVEFLQSLSGINLANRTNAVGATLGLMRKLGNNLYWNIVEVSFKKLNHPVFWLDVDFVLEAKTGFTYNLRIKNK